MKHFKTPLVGIAAATLVAGVGIPMTTAQAANGNYKYARAVDGDTVQLGNGRYVRLLGYDTPEVGKPCYGAAKAKMASLVSGGVKLVNVSGKDRYGRTVAYVQTKDGRDVGTVMLRPGLAIARYDGRDVGTVMLRQSLAIARYDGRDGYGWHPKHKKYRKLDRQNGSISCTTASKPQSKPTPTYTPRPAAPPVAPPPPVNVYYANCHAVRAAGKAPIRVGDPGYGSGCE